MRALLEILHCLFTHLSYVIGTILVHILAEVSHGIESLEVLTIRAKADHQLSLRKAQSNSTVMSVASNELTHVNSTDDRGPPETDYHPESTVQVSGSSTTQLLQPKASLHVSYFDRDGTRNSWNGSDTQRIRVGKSLETRSATNSLRRKRFERRRRRSSSISSTENMPDRKHSPVHHDELKFRSDFQQCFRQFPLENVFRRSWDIHESSIHNLADKATAQQLERLFYDDVESLFLAPDPELPSATDSSDPEAPNTTGSPSTAETPSTIETPSTNTLCDFSLPVHPDGSLIAELDAVDTSWSSVRAEEIARANTQAIVSKMAVGAHNSRRHPNDRFTKRLPSSRPLSWAMRASIKLQNARKKQERDHPMPDASLFSEIVSPQTSPSRTIETPEQGLSQCHSGLPKLEARSEIIVNIKRKAATIKSDNFSWMDEDYIGEVEPIDKMGHMASVGSCCIFIATQEQ